MAISTIASRLAIKKETSEGVLVDIDAGTEFIPLRPGFTFVPNIESIANDEIRSSIGVAKALQGIESPQANLPELLKTSGLEGVAPNWGVLLESLFGSVVTNSTERTLTSGSTAIQLVAAAGGTDFPRGTGILVKDGSNGYNLRASDGNSTNNIPLSFALPVPPLTGVKLGKSVTYTPTNSDQPTLSAWLYRGNGGALEAIAGIRVTDLELEVTVGQIITATFTCEGVGFYMNPIRIDASHQYIDFTDDTNTFAAVVPVGVYKDPVALASAIVASMNAANPLKAKTVTFNSLGTKAGKFTFASAGALFSILWDSGANTANSIATKVGFTTGADSTGALTYDSLSVQSYAAQQSPSYDAADPMVAKAMEILVGDQSNYDSICAQSCKISVKNTKQNVTCISALSGVEGSIFNKRECEITLVVVLNQHDVDKFDRFLNNTDTKFQFNFGAKSGGNWTPGKVGMVYVPTCTISAYQHGDANGVVTMEYTIKPFVDASGDAEIYLSFN